MKKTWQSPRLIILARGKPEEAILVSCKADHVQSGFPSITLYGCDSTGACLYCVESVNS